MYVLTHVCMCCMLLMDLCDVTPMMIKKYAMELEVGI